MYAKASQVQYELPKGEDGWNKFTTAIRIRDRLTHPKRPKDLAVSEDDVMIVLTAYSWVFKCEIDLLQLATERLQTQAKEESGKLESLPLIDPE